MCGSNLFYCFYLLMLLSSSYGLAIRNRRRIVAGDENLVMSELEKQCCRSSWSACCDDVHFLKRKQMDYCQKNITRTIDEYRTRIQSETEENIDEEEICIYSNQETNDVRELYCKNLHSLNQKLFDDIIPKIEQYGSCAKWAEIPPSDGESYMSISQIQNAIYLWHTSFVNRHKRRTSCCSADNRITVLPKGSVNDPSPSTNCPQKWSEALRDFQDAFTYMEYIQSLGRRPNKCIRGCVGMDSMECARTFFESVIPTPPPATEAAITYQSATNSQLPSVQNQ